MTVLEPSPVHGAAAVHDLPMERVNAPQGFWRGFGGTVTDIWRYRELLTNLVRKELKVKYKGSFLGFAWSLARPILMLVIYYIAIGKFLKSPVPDFVVFLFSGLVAWTFFADVVTGATSAITGNAGLIKKVYFPREILPLSVVGAALVQLALMLLVLFTVVLLSGRHVGLVHLLYLPYAMVPLLLFSVAIALLMSAANVYLRDTQHLVEVGLLFWFYMTPVLYAYGTVQDKIVKVGPWLEQLYLANPLAIVAFGFQDAIYQTGQVDGVQLLYDGPLALRLGILTAVSAAFLWFSQRVFARAQGNFAQEL